MIPARTFPRRLGAPVLGAALLLLAGCGSAPDPIGADGRPILSGTPPTPPVPILAVTSAPAALPEPPPALGVGAAAGMTTVATLGAAGYGAVAMVGVCLPSGPFALLCAPIGAVVGGTMGLAAGAIDSSRSPGSEAEALRRAEVLARHLQPERLGNCLRDTLVARSGGRLVAAGAEGPGVLRTALGEIRLAPQGGSQFNPSNPVLALTISARAALGGQDGGADQARSFTWRGQPSDYARWAANDGALLEERIGIALGLISRRILAEMFGEAEFPLPRGSSAREALRTACQPPPPVAAAPAAGAG
jgi:hypothetical protein